MPHRKFPHHDFVDHYSSTRTYLLTSALLKNVLWVDDVAHQNSVGVGTLLVAVVAAGVGSVVVVADDGAGIDDTAADTAVDTARKTAAGDGTAVDTASRTADVDETVGTAAGSVDEIAVETAGIAVGTVADCCAGNAARRANWSQAAVGGVEVLVP
jgi:hypothetical protein